MRKMNRIEFLKAMGRWGTLAALAGFGATLFSREKKSVCNGVCGSCSKFEHGKCRIGLK
ncbi:MAG: hypothetical protein JXR23_04370 [Pontiellaceae bacterium]|nr:hypothetical protein [Pontiellaceae bacterium]